MPDTKHPIRILHLEDSPRDAELIEERLKAGGLACDIVCVDSKERFEAALAGESFDLVLCDHNLIDYDGISAMKLTRQKQPETPVLLISGTLGEEEAVRCLQHGAADYLVKERLERLPAAVSRALHEAAEHHQRRQAQEELYVSKEHFQNLFELSPDGIIVATRSGLIHAVNRHAERLFGYPRAELVGQPVESLMPRRFSAGHAALREKYAQDPRLRPMGEARNLFAQRKDGSEFPVEISLSPITTAEGMMVISTIRDITVRKEAEIRITKLNRVYRVLSAVNQMIVRVRDPQAMFDAVCQIVVEKGGLRMAWVGLVDSTRTSVKPVARAGVPDEHWEKLNVVLGDDLRGRGPLAVALRDGTHVVCNDLEHDPRLTPWQEDARRLGYRALAVLPLTVGSEKVGTFNIYASEPDFFDDEEMTLLDELAMDIGFALEVNHREVERQRADAALQESERIRRLVLDNVDEIIYMVESSMDNMLSGKVRFVGGRVQKILDYHPEEFIRDPDLWFSILHPDDAPGLAESTRALFASGQPGLREYRVRHKRTANYHWMEDHVVPQLDAAGRVVGQFGSARDVTERKRIDAESMRTQRLESIGTLASGVSHDLNNALAPILMASELLRVEFPDRAAPLLELIQAGARRGADLVKQLLTFAKGAEGERLLVQPQHLLKEIAKLIAGTFPKNIELRTSYAKDLRTLLGDATQLHQVLLNLCVNARDAMPNGGTLTLEAENVEIDASYARVVPGAKPGHYVVWRVRDNGTGIPPEIIDRIFEPFFSTKAPDKGTGLGLSTVIGIVKSHGGFLQIDSVPGQGSTFAVYLPACAADTGDTSLLVESEGTFRGKGETVLVVDDEPFVREVMRTVLAKLNFSVLTAADGTAALVQVTQKPAELRAVITDLHMPHMDGLSFVRVLKARLPQAGIIVMSGRLDEQALNEFKALGVSALLDKPFSQEKLVEALKTVFQK